MLFLGEIIIALFSIVVIFIITATITYWIHISRQKRFKEFVNRIRDEKEKKSKVKEEKGLQAS